MARKRKTDTCDGCGQLRPVVNGEIQCPECDRRHELAQAGTFTNLAAALRIEAGRHRGFYYPGKDLIVDSFNRLADAVDPPVESKERQKKIDAVQKAIDAR